MLVVGCLPVQGTGYPWMFHDVPVPPKKRGQRLGGGIYPYEDDGTHRGFGCQSLTIEGPGDDDVTFNGDGC